MVTRDKEKWDVCVGQWRHENHDLAESYISCQDSNTYNMTAHSHVRLYWTYTHIWAWGGGGTVIGLPIRLPCRKSKTIGIVPDIRPCSPLLRPSVTIFPPLLSLAFDLLTRWFWLYLDETQEYIYPGISIPWDIRKVKCLCGVGTQGSRTMSLRDYDPCDWGGGGRGGGGGRTPGKRSLSATMLCSDCPAL